MAWGDPLLASLRANEALDILSLNRPPAPDRRLLVHHLDEARRLRLAFPTKPVLLTRFGTAPQARSPSESAISESILWLGSFDRGLAGAGELTISDPVADSMSSSRSFGLLTSAPDEAKPAPHTLPVLGRYLRSTRRPRGHLEIAGEPDSRLRLRFAADDALFASGRDVIDEGCLRWEGRGTARIFLPIVADRVR